MKIDGVNESHHEDLLGKSFRGSRAALEWTERSTLKLDNNGVLLYKIPYTNKFDYYPTFIARYALGNLEMYLDTKSNMYKEGFLNQVDWLISSLVIKDGFAIWGHHYVLPYYDFNKIPWVHGLGQSLGMTALLKAYQLTEDNDYLEASKKVYRSFEIDISDGGVRFVDANGHVWLEEYALLPPPHVLNGFITILFGVHEFCQATKNSDALDLWNEGIKTLRMNLKKFDIGYWSLYDLLHRYPSSMKYHAMHVRQLKVLHHLTEEKLFRDYADAWEQYMNKRINRTQARLMRGVLHLKRYGPTKCLRRYFGQKKWQKEQY